MRSSFSRFLFPGAIILLVALLLVGIAFFMLTQNYLDEQATKGLVSDCDTICSLAEAYYIENSMSGGNFLVNLSVASRVADSDTVICDLTGQLVLCSHAPLGCEHQGNMINPGFLQQVLQAGQVCVTTTVPGLYQEMRYLVAKPILDASGHAVGFVLVSTPTANARGVMKQMLDIYLSVSVLVVFIAGIFMTMLARRHANPLRDLANAASAFGHGKLDARVKIDPSSPAEVQELSLAFNNMASSLQKSEYQRQEFVANVSHELKTPMTTISGMVDGMLDGTIPQDKHPHYMQIVSEETKRLSRLVRSMLDISRLQDQSGIPDEQKYRFDVEECCGQVLITFEQKILGKELNVQVDMPEHPVYTFANQDYITQVVYNLLDNAVKFCPVGGELGLKIRLGSNKIYVSISNNGDTIPPQELPLVFDRFHKLDKSRTQNRDGWGLGLYIVKTIICSHGEDISVSSKDGITEFTFTLPLVN